VHRALLVLKVYRDQLAHKALKGYRVLKGLRERRLRELQVWPGLLVLKVSEVQLVLVDSKVHRDR
jgi:hypothetical protein